MDSIQYASDLHLEFYELHEYKFENFIVPKSDILVLLGDIGYPSKSLYKIFLNDCSKNFKLVLLITGNHEYYANFETSMDSVNTTISELCKLLPNVIFLNNSTYSYKYEDKEIIFLGSTLWSFILPNERIIVKQVSNDLCNIFLDGQPITINQINELHKCNVEWIQTTLDSIDNDNATIIILTHHLPTYKAIVPKYRNSNCNSMFASNLDHIIKKYNIFAWLFGHTHSKIDIVVENTILLCNPLGYTTAYGGRENEKYDASCTLLLPDKKCDITPQN